MLYGPARQSCDRCGHGGVLSLRGGLWLCKECGKKMAGASAGCNPSVRHGEEARGK